MKFPDSPATGDPSRSFIVMPEHDQAMEETVESLLLHCPAQFVLVIERSGYLLTVAGQQRSGDLCALASLVAGDMAASQEIARRTGQDRGCALTLREGPDAITLMVGTGPDLILFAQVSKEVPIGWARLLIQECGRQLVKVLGTPAGEVEKLDLGFRHENLAAWFDNATGAFQAE